MNKRGLIVLLVGMNLFLLAAIVFSVYTPPSALAQAAGARRGEYLLMAGRAEVTNDAIYLIDSGNKKIHVFRSGFPQAGAPSTGVQYMSTYDLTRDFLDQAAPAAGAAAPVPNQPPPGGLPQPPAGGVRP